MLFYPHFPRLMRVYKVWALDEIAFTLDQIKLKYYGRKNSVSPTLAWIMKDIFIMAKTKSPKGANFNGKQYSGNIKWVNHTLTKDERIAFQDFSLSDRETLDAIYNLAERGYTLSIKPPKDDEGGYNAFLMGTWLECENAGCGLSAYAAEPATALAVLLFKHFVVFTDGKWPITDKRDESDFG